MALSSSEELDSLSDYGSEFTPDEEQILSDLLGESTSRADNPLQDPDLRPRNVEDDLQNSGPKIFEVVSCQCTASGKASGPVRIRFEDSSSRPTKVESDASRNDRERSVSIEAPYDPPPTPDLRSPLERFRTKPKKPLSVSDLISPSWCELQYWYVLTKHGRKRRTPAMRQGSAVHKTLEDQVHTTVAVDIQTKEDAWGLRIWNAIQGLKTLRETGMTRELEVWGILDGQVVNGVIDELSYVCPDRELEAASLADAVQKSGRKPKMPQLAPDQATITEFLSARSGLGGQGTLESDGANIFQSGASASSPSKIYICDVKTRTVPSLPKGASFRPTLIQLSLYHRLLSDLADGNVDPLVLFDRYDLDPHIPFTDSFIAQIGTLNEHLWIDAESPPSSSSDPDVDNAMQDSLTTLTTHNTLLQLFHLLLSAYRTTFPQGRTSLSPLLKAEYRDATTGDILGAKTVVYDAGMLQRYLAEEMEWWRGERPARGVAVDEVFKCGSCEFRDGCEWRAGKVEEQVRQMRERRSRV